MPIDLFSLGTLRGLGTLLVLIAFVSLVLWAYSGKRQSSFDQAALLPFADEPQPVVRSPQP